jgi:alkyl hydroperoxide reductase subunit AhpF
LAIENNLIEADCVEATEFPELADRYRVYAVPKTVVNGESFIEGALPEEFFVDRILEQGGAAAGEETIGE